MKASFSSLKPKIISSHIPESFKQLQLSLLFNSTFTFPSLEDFFAIQLFAGLLFYLFLIKFTVCGIFQYLVIGAYFVPLDL